MLIWVAYKFIPEGSELIRLILNASGLAGAAAILGIFYNKTKNEVDRPKISVNSEDISEKTKKNMEESLKGVSARKALNNFVEMFKENLKEITANKQNIDLNAEKYFVEIFDHKEKVFVLQSEELIKAGYERECQELIKKIEIEHNYFVFGMPLRGFNPILTAKYPFEDSAAENKICLDVYCCKEETLHRNVKVYGYAIIYAYYNTEMLVSCWEFFERTADNVECLKAYMQSKNQDRPQA
jgi:hypothetical protein